MATALKNKNNGWIKTVLNDPKYFQVVGSGVDAWVGKKNFLSTKSVQGTKIASIESEIDYFNRPSRANMQPKIGRVAFAKMRDTLKVLLSDKELSKFYILSTGFALIKPQIESAYLYQVLQTQRFNLQKDRYAEGSTQQAISQSDFDKLTISFPEDRQGQRKITEILSVIDGAIEKTDALIEKYKRMKTGMMQDLFRYGIDDKEKIRSEKTHKFKKSPLGKIPEEWGFKKLGSLREFITSGSRAWAQYYSDEGALFIRIGNLSRENIRIRFDDVVYVSPPNNSEGNRTNIKTGDVLVSITADLGIVALAPRSLRDAYVNQHIALLRFTDIETLSPWVAFYLWSNGGQKQFQVLNDGGAKAGLNLPTVDSILIPLPSKEERKKIIQSMMSIEEIILKESTEKYKLERIKNGLMEDLLTGIVRVNLLLK